MRLAADKALRTKRRGAPLRAVTDDAEKDKYLTGFFLACADIEELTDHHPSRNQGLRAQVRRLVELAAMRSPV